MRKTVHKWFWAWEFEKEEKWLMDMASKGLALTSVHFCTYDFDECIPGEYAIRLEMLETSPTGVEGQQYIRFVEETGAEYLGRVKNWVYFRKKRELGEFELHGDIATRVKHLQGILRLLAPLTGINIAAGLYNLIFGLKVGSWINVACAGLSAALTVLLVLGLIKLNNQKKALEKESQLYES